MSIPSAAGLEAMLTREERSMPVVSVFGEVDLATVEELESILAQAVSRAGEAGAVADLRGIEFMDVMGVRALLHARKSLKTVAPEGRLFVVCQGQLKELLEFVGLDRDLALCLDLYEARDMSCSKVSTNGRCRQRKK